MKSKLLLLGSEAGNVYILRSDTFELSNQIIRWNHAIGPAVDVHPGAAISLTSCPQDENKLYIGYSTHLVNPSDSKGLIIRWNLKSKRNEATMSLHCGLTSLCWNFDGKSFICSHVDGSYTIWNTKRIDKPTKFEFLHESVCKKNTSKLGPINKILWLFAKNGTTYTVFSGGIHLDNDTAGRSQYLTIIRKNTTNVLLMDSFIVDFCAIGGSPVVNEPSDPVALAVLLETELVLIDLKSDDYLFFDSPHTMNLNKDAVTFMTYVAQPSNDFYNKLLKIQNNKASANAKETRSSQMPFPLSGGIAGNTIFSYNEIIITGHTDGVIKFWDCSALNFSFLYEVSTSRYLSRCRTPEASGESQETEDEQIYAIKCIKLSDDYQHMVVTGFSGHIVIFGFSDAEKEKIDEGMQNLEYLDICLDNSNESGTQEEPSNEPTSFQSLLKAKVACRRVVGYYPELICIFHWPVKEAIPIIHNFDYSSENLVLAVSIGNFLVVVDCISKFIIMNMSVSDLSGAYESQSRLQNISPKAKQQSISSHVSEQQSSDSAEQHELSSDSDMSNKDKANKLESLQTDNKQSLKVLISEENKEKNQLDELIVPEEDPLKETQFTEDSAISNIVVPPREKSNKPNVLNTAVNSNENCQKSEISKRKHSAAGMLLKRLAHSLKRLDPSVLTINDFRSDAQENSERSESTSSDSVFLPSPSTFEIITSLMFLTLQTDKNDEDWARTFWIGTSYGFVLVFNLCMSGDEPRYISMAPNGNLLRFAGKVLLLSVIDVAYSDSKSSTPSSKNEYSASLNSSEKLFVVIVSEKHAKTMCLPSFCCSFKCVFTEAVTSAWVSTLNDSYYLCCYHSTQKISLYGLPKLRPLQECTLSLIPDALKICMDSTFCLSKNGHAAYMASPSEIQKLTISASVSPQVDELLCTLYDTSIPDVQTQTKSSFFKFLRRSSVEHNELFSNDKNSKPFGILKQSSIDKQFQSTQSKLATDESEMSQVLQAGVERGQKLGQLEMSAAQMAENASEFRNLSKQIAQQQMESNEKWWQLWKF